MNKLLTATGALVVGLAASAPAWAQPALERLEDQVRDRVDRSNRGGARGPNDSAAEPGYLGVIADDRQEPRAGVRLVKVYVGGPADRSGLEVGDLVTSIDGRPVRSIDDFAGVLAGVPPGGTLVFEIERDDATEQIEIVLGRRPPPDERPFDRFGRIPEQLPEPEADERLELLGVFVVPVDRGVQALLQLPAARGALVVEVNEGSPAQAAGVRVESVIVAVQGQRIDTPADLARLLGEAGPGAEIKVAYYREGKLFERKFHLAESHPAEGQDELEGAPLEAGAAGPTAQQRIEMLERRIRNLEQRIEELESRLGKD